MRQRPKPAKTKVEAKSPIVGKSQKTEDSSVRDLEKRLAEAVEREAEASRREAEALEQLQTRERDLVEAQERQAATAEILRAISGSPTNLQAMLNIVAENAARVCGATDALVLRLEDGTLRLVASYGDIPAVWSPPLDRGVVAGRAVIDRETVHVHDLAAAE